MNPSNLSRSDFPNYNSVLDAVQDCDVIKYAAYRTAAKLRVLQGALFTDKLPLRIIANIYDRHHLHPTENSVQIDENELEPVLHDIYFVMKKEYYPDLNISHAVTLMTKYLFNVFDKKKNKSIQVLCTKIGLTILCSAKPREKYQYLFNELADYNSCLSKKKLETLLKKILYVTEYVSEELYFRTDLIPGTVESCFQNNSGTLGVSENDFMSWLVQDPQILVWLSTLYRMQLSETVCHSAKCSVCRIYPIIGLRYRCLRCLCYNQCQSCFFMGKYNKKHKLTHPVQEYCFEVTSGQSTKAFLLTIKNRLMKTNSKLQYLPAEKINSSYVDALSSSSRLLDEMEMSSRTVINGSRISLQNQPQKELHSIIIHLEKETEKIIPLIERLCARKECDRGDCQFQLKKCLVNHKNQVEQQVKRLKSLRDGLASNSSSKLLLESTPVVDGGSGKIRLNGVGKELEDISPITRRKFDGGSKDRDLLLKKMMWDKYDIVNGTVATSWEEVKDSQCGTDLPEGIDPQTVNSIRETPVDGNTNGMDLSTWLGGSALRDMEYSTNRGFTRWLNPDGKGSSRENTLQSGEGKDDIRLENEKYLHEIEYDLEDILNKLQRLTSGGGSGSSNSTDSSEKENITKLDEDVMSDVDSLLVGLINGLDKLMSN